MRWIGKELDEGVALILEGMVIILIPRGKAERGITYRRGCGVDLAGGVGTLSYEHHNINEPAILYVPLLLFLWFFSFSFFFSFLSFPLLHSSTLEHSFLPCKLNYTLTTFFLQKYDRLGGSFAVE